MKANEFNIRIMHREGQHDLFAPMHFNNPIKEINDKIIIRHYTTNDYQWFETKEEAEFIIKKGNDIHCDTNI